MPRVGTVQRVSCPGDFEWKIENISSLLETVDYPWYLSPDFAFCDRSWRLGLWTHSEKDYPSEGFVGLYLFLQDGFLPLEVRFSLGVKTEKGEHEVWFENGDTSDGDVWDPKKYVKRSELLLRREEVFPSDVLTVRATLKNMEEEGVRKEDSQPSSDPERDVF